MRWILHDFLNISANAHHLLQQFLIAITQFVLASIAFVDLVLVQQVLVGLGLRNGQVLFAVGFLVDA